MDGRSQSAIEDAVKKLKSETDDELYVQRRKYPEVEKELPIGFDI